MFFFYRENDEYANCGNQEDHRINVELQLEIKRQLEIRRSNIQNIKKENAVLLTTSKVRAAEFTITKVNGLQLSVRIHLINSKYRYLGMHTDTKYPLIYLIENKKC